MKSSGRTAVRMCALLATGFIATVPAYAEHEERTVDIGGLAASLVRPTGQDRAPTAVIIAGSGPTDRDGNSTMGLRTDAYKLLAHALAAQGIASLRYDKRGVGGSAGIAIPEPQLTIDVFAKDAAAMAAWVGGQPGAGPVSFVGHSEGGLIALLAAGINTPKAIVLVSAPGRPFGDLLREQLSRPDLPAPLSAESMAIIAALERAELVATVSPELAAVFRPSVQSYLISAMRVDPVKRLQSLQIPVMVVGGGKDVQMARADFDALVAARAGVESFWAPAMGHTLKAVSDDPASQQRAYTDPTIPLLDGLTARIAAFVHAASRR